MTTSSTALVRGARSTQTTIALKMLMAVTGLIFIVFVLLHMYGNLKAFAGHDGYNDYAEHLRTLGETMLPYSGFLWALRAVLIVALVLHVWAALKLTFRARRARRVRAGTRARSNGAVSELGGNYSSPAASATSARQRS